MTKTEYEHTVNFAEAAAREGKHDLAAWACERLEKHWNAKKEGHEEAEALKLLNPLKEELEAEEG